MRRHIAGLAVVLALAAPVLAQGPKVDFDRGVDMEAVAAHIREAASAPGAQALKAALAAQVTKDCALVAFSFESLPISAPVSLQSHIFQRVCESYHGKKTCYDKLVRVVRQNIVVALTGTRTILPWERDVFEVCLQGDGVAAKTVMASSRYAIAYKPGAGVYRVEALAQEKLKTAPDPGGIGVESFAYDQASGGLKLALKDKWAAYYQGEKTVLKVVLKKVVPHWFDSVIIEKEFELKPQDAYEVRFVDYAAAFKRPIERGMEYFVEWGFKRLGRTSRPDDQKGGTTPRAVQP